MKTRRIGTGARILVHASIGAILGYLVLHPVAMLGTGPATEQSHLSIFLASISRMHLAMAAYFGAVGAACGFVHALYRQAIYEKSERIRVIEGLLPICAGCKRIRDDAETEHGKGPWMPVEAYVSERTGAQFTHSMCPECMSVWYPELNARGRPSPARP